MVDLPGLGKDLTALEGGCRADMAELRCFEMDVQRYKARFERPNRLGCGGPQMKDR